MQGMLSTATSMNAPKTHSSLRDSHYMQHGPGQWEERGCLLQSHEQRKHPAGSSPLALARPASWTARKRPACHRVMRAHAWELRGWEGGAQHTYLPQDHTTAGMHAVEGWSVGYRGGVQFSRAAHSRGLLQQQTLLKLFVLQGFATPLGSVQLDIAGQHAFHRAAQDSCPPQGNASIRSHAAAERQSHLLRNH